MKFSDLKNKSKKQLQTYPSKETYNHQISKIYKRKNTLLRSFQLAMDSADGTEIFTVDGIPDIKWTCAVSNLKDNWNQDKKMLCIDNLSNVDVGSIVRWERTKSEWLITLQDYNIEDYFKCEIWKINQYIKWKDETGKINLAKVYAQGPVESRAKYDDTRSVSIVGKPNDTVEITMSAKDYNNGIKKFNRLLIKNKAWKIQVIDDISSDNIVRLSMVEDYINDNDDLPSLIPYNDLEHLFSEEQNNLYILGPSTINVLDDILEFDLMSDGNKITKYNGIFILTTKNHKIESKIGKFYNLELIENEKITVVYKDKEQEIKWENRVRGLI